MKLTAKDVTSCVLQAFPMLLKLYALSAPMTKRIALEGRRADSLSLKLATPEGRDKTPAPRIVLAKLKMREDTVAVPPESPLTDVSDKSKETRRRRRERDGLSAIYDLVA